MIGREIGVQQSAHYQFRKSTVKWPGTRLLDQSHHRLDRMRQHRFAAPICSDFRAESLLLLGHPRIAMVFRLMLFMITFKSRPLELAALSWMVQQVLLEQMRQLLQVLASAEVPEVSELLATKLDWMKTRLLNLIDFKLLDFKLPQHFGRGSTRSLWLNSVAITQQFRSQWATSCLKLQDLRLSSSLYRLRRSDSMNASLQSHSVASKKTAWCRPRSIA